MKKKMKFIGVTGGVGAGKSEILAFLKEWPRTRVMLADEIAHELMQAGTSCYDRLCEAFQGEDLFLEGAGVGASFDRIKLAKLIFTDDKKRERLNKIVHPAVKEYVQSVWEEEKKKNELDFLVLEAALLIEEHYDTICDELWYIYTREDVRRERLKRTRGYSDEKIDGIFASQLSEDVYRAHCKRVIDNNGSRMESLKQVEDALRRVADE